MDRLAVSAERRALVAAGCVVVLEPATVLQIQGPGADQCLQGLLTADILAPGPGSLSYAALLTPKGMIVADYWCLRRAEDYLLVADPAARAPSLERLGRSLPPRLARLTDRTGELVVAWVLGARAGAVLELVMGPLPAPGKVLSGLFEGDPVTLATPAAARAPFRHLVVLTAAAADELGKRLASRGAVIGDRTDLRLARVAHGFPTLGAEIDDKTMPAEVDFDALDGVSHRKGCYVGQETVARLHFRGHANWLLRSISIDGPASVPATIEQDGKPVARVGTLVETGTGPVVGLAKVRRELEPGARVDLPGGAMTVLAADGGG